MLFIALAMWLFQKNEHKVVVTFSSDEIKEIVSKDVEYINKVARALNDAVVFRGKKARGARSLWKQ